LEGDAAEGGQRFGRLNDSDALMLSGYERDMRDAAKTLRSLPARPSNARSTAPTPATPTSVT
jgi:hypothetical protein